MPPGFPGLPSDWVSEWTTFRSADDEVQLFSMTHHREPWSGSEAHRVLLVIHGFGEHGGRYLHFPHYLKNQVSAVECMDLRGHGRSEGLRGHIHRFDQFVDDVTLAIRRLDEVLRKRFGKSEIHLLGHSMGGHIVLRTLLQTPDLPLASATVSAPFLALKARVPWVKKAGARVLALVWDTLQLDTGLDATLLSHDKGVVETYQKDRLVHGRMTPRFFESMNEAQANTLKRDQGITVPLLMLVPEQDGIVDEDVNTKFFHSLNLAEKRLKTYPGFFHESFNETEKERVFQDFAQWISEHSR